MDENEINNRLAGRATEYMMFKDDKTAALSIRFMKLNVSLCD